MGTYAANTDVTSRIPSRPVSSDSSPSTANIDSWITGAEAKIHGRLAAAGIGTPITNSDGVLILKEWVCDYALGRALIALGGGFEGDASFDAGTALVKGFQAWLDSIADDPGAIDAELNGGSSGDTTRKVKAYVLDNDDDKSISGGDFEPVFDREEVF